MLSEGVKRGRKKGRRVDIEFRYKLVESKTTNPETLNRLRRLMMAFEQTANQVMPEFRLHFEEVQLNSSPK